MTGRMTTIMVVAFLAGASAVRAAEVPDDTAPEMKVKSRKLVFKADPNGLDWAARGSLTKTKTGRWIATYTQAAAHGRVVPRNVVVHASDDEGRTWSEPNCLPDGTPVKGAPLRAENEQVEPCDGGVLTCPNGDLLYLSMSCEHIKGKKRPEDYQTRQWRSADNGASWKYEGRAPGIPADVTFCLGKTVEGQSIYIAALTRSHPTWAVLYRSDDNGHTWKMVSEYAAKDDRINETGVVCVDEDTIMVVCRSWDEKTTKMRISRDRGKTWGPMTDITKYVHVVQQPKLTKFPEEPGRIYLTGRDRILEYKQRNCLWYTEDCGKTWKMKPVDDAYFRDSGYGEILKRKNGDLYYLGYRGTDDAADSWEFILESDYKAGRDMSKRKKPASIITKPVDDAAGALRISADIAEGGSIRVAVHGDRNRTLAACKPITEDVTEGRVTWEDDNPLTAGKTALEFELQSAKLYAFSFGPPRASNALAQYEGGEGKMARFNPSWMLAGEKTGDGEVPKWVTE